jgi:hypothetical protein
MLSETSFFKRIPTVIALEDRLIWEGAGWAIDMIFWSYDRLKRAATHIDTNSTEFPTSLAQEMFACAWSIIDQCHMLRAIFRRSGPPEDGPTSKFLEKFEAATRIRNAMDHLHSNVKNLANKKGSFPPLFGALSFCTVGPDEIVAGEHGKPNIRGCKIVTITAGALTHPNHGFRGVNPAGRLIELPVGLFEFEAFEHRLSFSELVSDLRKLVELYDTVVKADRDERIRELAREKGLDGEKLINEHLGSLMIALHVAFEPTGPTGDAP